MRPEIIQKLVDRIESLTGEDPFYCMITRDEITLLVHLSESLQSKVDAAKDHHLTVLESQAKNLQIIREMKVRLRALVLDRNAARRMYCQSESRRRRCSPETIANHHGWMDLYPTST